MGAADDAPILTIRTRPDLRAWLQANHASQRRCGWQWIKTAKTPETRAKRIWDVTDSALLGVRPSPFRR